MLLLVYQMRCDQTSSVLTGALIWFPCRGGCPAVCRSSGDLPPWSGSTEAAVCHHHVNRKKKTKFSLENDLKPRGSYDSLAFLIQVFMILVTGTKHHVTLTPNCDPGASWFLLAE